MAHWLYLPNQGPDESSQFWPVLAMYHHVAPGDGVFIYRDFGVEAFCTRRFEARDCNHRTACAGECLEHCFHLERFAQPLPRMALGHLASAWKQLTRLESQPPNQRTVPLDEETANWLLQLGMTEQEAAPLELPAWLGATEAIRLRKERLTQGIYRDRLMAFWGRACAVTQISDPTFLRASHIKPWADSSPQERMDPRNGLLLAVNYDFAFDKGLITFSDEGSLEVHPKVDAQHLQNIGVNPNAQITRALDAKQKGYLAFHQAEVFGKWQSPNNQPVLGAVR